MRCMVIIECACGCRNLLEENSKWGYKRKFIAGHNLLKQKGELHPCWKGGRYIDKFGYVVVWVESHPKAYKHTIREHILVMEKHIGRYLNDDEEVHHINGNKQDNRIENLKLVTKIEHSIIHQRLRYPKEVMDARRCVLCSKQTYTESKGHRGWYKYKDGYMCKRCYDKNIRHK